MPTGSVCNVLSVRQGSVIVDSEVLIYSERDIYTALDVTRKTPDQMFAGLTATYGAAQVDQASIAVVQHGNPPPPPASPTTSVANDDNPAGPAPETTIGGLPDILRPKDTPLVFDIVFEELPKTVKVSWLPPLTCAQLPGRCLSSQGPQDG